MPSSIPEAVVEALLLEEEVVDADGNANADGHVDATRKMDTDGKVGRI